MAKVYADLIRKGLKTVDEVPSPLQEEVRQIIVMA
ncbi:CD1375 family protein [Paenibacillus durus]|nr:CD1375 family protein [Paenibacillus durus]